MNQLSMVVTAPGPCEKTNNYSFYGKTFKHLLCLTGSGILKAQFDFLLV